MGSELADFIPPKVCRYITGNENAPVATTTNGSINWIEWTVADGFLSEQLANGCHFRALHLIDDFSCEMIEQLVVFSISERQVFRFISI